MRKWKVGDIMLVEATGDLAPHIECEVLEIAQDDGRVTKMRAVVPDERLLKLGFMIEGEDFVVVEWDYWPN